jgi:glutaredoxin
MTSFMKRLLGRDRGPRAGHLTFTVYSRDQCGCCTKALDLLKDAQRRYGFAIEEVDVDSDPDLVAKYNTDVPVIAVDGKIRFRGVVNKALLERLLEAESRNRASKRGAPPAGN